MPEAYAFYSGTDLIGYSALEHADPSMGIRIGRFHPEKGYDALGSFYQQLSIVSFEESQAAGETEKRRILQERREQLQRQAASIVLYARTSTGEQIPTLWIHIEDFSEELGEEGREVTLCVDDYLTYERFFS